MRLFPCARVAGRARCQALYGMAFAALAACHPHEPDVNVAERVPALAGYLAFAPPATASTIPPPPSAALQITIPASSLDNLDFLLLSGCAVQATIIKRNSALGRAAKPSQRLLLALEFLRLAPQCIQRLQELGNVPLATRLENAWQEHRAQLPALVFNGTLGSDEYRAFWLTYRAPTGYPRTEAGAASAASLGIDSEVQRWLQGDYRAQHLRFELQLSDVAGGDGGARLQTLIQRGDDRALRRYRTAVKSILGLELQLAAVLPPQYRLWQRQRSRLVAEATRQISPSEQQLQEPTTPNLSPTPNVEENGYTATPTATRYPP